MSFHPAKGRPVQSSLFFPAGTVGPSFTVVDFWCFQLQISGFPAYAIAKSTVALIFLLFISGVHVFSKMCNSNYGVSVCVCVSAFLLRANIITVNFSVILFLIFFNSEMKR